MNLATPISLERLCLLAFVNQKVFDRGARIGQTAILLPMDFLVPFNVSDGTITHHTGHVDRAGTRHDLARTARSCRDRALPAVDVRGQRENVGAHYFIFAGVVAETG